MLGKKELTWCQKMVWIFMLGSSVFLPKLFYQQKITGSDNETEKEISVAEDIDSSELLCTSLEDDSFNGILLIKNFSNFYLFIFR